MKSKHDFEGSIVPYSELTNFINPIEFSLDVDKRAYRKIFKEEDKMHVRINMIYDDMFNRFIPNMSLSDRAYLKKYLTFSYTPHTNGYDFRINPVNFINQMFYLYGIPDRLDYFDLDNTSSREAFIKEAYTKLTDASKQLDDRSNTLLDIRDNLYGIMDYYYLDINSAIKEEAIPKTMLFYLAYKSLLEYRGTDDLRYMVLPYEYYNTIGDMRKCDFPHTVPFNDGITRWYDDFWRDYKRFYPDNEPIDDKPYRLKPNVITIGIELVKPGHLHNIVEHNMEPRNHREIDFDKYQRLLDRKIRCYESSGYDTCIRGELGLEGYIGFKYGNENIILDQLYQSDDNGVRDLLIYPKAFYGLPSDRLSLITYTKPLMIAAKDKDPRIERHYHRDDSNSFERNVQRISTGPNVSISTFDEEIEKLKKNVRVKSLTI